MRDGRGGTAFSLELQEGPLAGQHRELRPLHCTSSFLRGAGVEKRQILLSGVEFSKCVPWNTGHNGDHTKRSLFANRIWEALETKHLLSFVFST